VGQAGTIGLVHCDVSLSGASGGCVRPHGAPQASDARQAAYGAAAVHGGAGCLWRGTSLEAQAGKLGHAVRLISPAQAKSCVKPQVRHAEAICEAATRPSMQLVPV
jgi:hypothetical protein